MGPLSWIVGGGLIGIEMAEMLHTRHIPVTFLVREQGYMDYLLPPEESAMINAEIRDHHIDLRVATGLQEVLPDDNGRAPYGGCDRSSESCRSGSWRC